MAHVVPGALRRDDDLGEVFLHVLVRPHTQGPSESPLIITDLWSHYSQVQGPADPFVAQRGAIAAHDVQEDGQEARLVRARRLCRRQRAGHEDYMGWRGVERVVRSRYALKPDLMTKKLKSCRCGAPNVRM